MASPNADATATVERGTAATVDKFKNKPKNAPGNRSDVAWKYGISIVGDAVKIKCKFCEKDISGGIYRLKHHLAGTKHNVEACLAVPDDVKKDMFQVLCGLQQKLVAKTAIVDDAQSDEDECVEVSGKRKTLADGSKTIFRKKAFGSQPTINSVLKKELKEDLDRFISVVILSVYRFGFVFRLFISSVSVSGQICFGLN